VPRFLYFIENARAATAQTLTDAGLDSVLTDPPAGGPTSCRESIAGPGPDRRGGIVVAAGGPGADLGYWPDDQAWTPIPGRAGVFLGLPAEGPPPGPDDLARAEIIAGPRIVLGDGREWIVPVARVFPGAVALPSALAIGPDGSLVGEVLPRFAAASRMADRIWDAICTAHGAPADPERPTVLDDLEGFELAVAILAINYRIAAAEASALRILTTTNVPAVLEAFVDWPTWLAHAKKNAPVIAEADNERPSGHPATTTAPAEKPETPDSGSPASCPGPTSRPEARSPSLTT